MSATRCPSTSPLSTIDPEVDDLIPVRTVTRQRLGRTISPATLHRWLRKGCRGVRLEAVQVCGVWHTTPEAFARFINGQTAAALGDDAPTAAPAPRTSEKLERLRAAGLLK